MIHPQKISFNDIKITMCDKQGAISLFSDLFRYKSPSLITTVNVEFLMLSLKNQQFNDVLAKKSKLNLVDGSGVLWGNAFLNFYQPRVIIIGHLYAFLIWLIFLIFYPFLVIYLSRKWGRVSGSDFIWDICKFAALNNKSIYLLGNKFGLDPNAVQKASLVLQTQIFDLRIAGTMSVSLDESQTLKITDAVKKSGADILLCSYGSPTQEIWLANNLNRCGVKTAIGLGGTFDFLSGVQKRAPKFIRLIGFEWLYRLIRQPGRIIRQKSLFLYLVYLLSKKFKSISHKNI